MSISILSCVPTQIKQTNISIFLPIFGLTVPFADPLWFAMYRDQGSQKRHNEKLGLNLLAICHKFSKTNALHLLFLFIFLSRWVNSNKFELIHLHKKIKIILTLNINIRLKVTWVFCILNSNGIDSVKQFNF